jgi:hypothetical protein
VPLRAYEAYSFTPAAAMMLLMDEAGEAPGQHADLDQPKTKTSFFFAPAPEPDSNIHANLNI